MAARGPQRRAAQKEEERKLILSGPCIRPISSSPLCTLRSQLHFKVKRRCEKWQGASNQKGGCQRRRGRRVAQKLSPDKSSLRGEPFIRTATAALAAAREEARVCPGPLATSGQEHLFFRHDCGPHPSSIPYSYRSCHYALFVFVLFFSSFQCAIQADYGDHP